MALEVAYICNVAFNIHRAFTFFEYLKLDLSFNIFSFGLYVYTLVITLRPPHAAEHGGV